MKDTSLLLFPTLVWNTKNLLSDSQNNLIQNHIVSVKDKVNGQGKNVWYSKYKSPQNSFNCNYYDSVFDNLINLVDEKISDYCKTIKFQEWRLTTRQWWWNVYNKENYQEFHGHVPYYLSAVYFCKLPEGSSPIVFKHPNFNQYLPVSEKTEYVSDSKEIYPDEMSLLIFPSTLIHCVPPGTNVDPRITISFNYGFL